MGEKMIKNSTIFLLFTIFVIMSCTSSDNKTNDNEENPQVKQSWALFIPGFKSMSNVLETSDNYVLFGNSYDNKDSYLIKVGKSGEEFETKEFKNTNVLEILENNGTFIALNQKINLESFKVSLIFLSEKGELEKEIIFENAELKYRHAIAKNDTGILFSYTNNNNLNILTFVDYSGNILWEKSFGNELDPQLPENFKLSVREVQNISVDSDKNFVIFQGVRKDPMDGNIYEDNSGFAYYKLNSYGDLLYAKSSYWNDARDDYDITYFVDSVLIMPDNNFILTGACMEHCSVGESFIDAKFVKYFDSVGDEIKTITHWPCSNIINIYGLNSNSILTAVTNRDPNVGEVYFKERDFDDNINFEKNFGTGGYYCYGDIRFINCSDGGFLYKSGSATLYAEQPTGIYILKIDKDKNFPDVVN